MTFRSSSSLAIIAKISAGARGAVVPAALMAEAMKAPREVIEVMKASVGAGSLSNSDWAGALAPYAGIVVSFVESLRSRSVFSRMLDDGLVRAPGRTPLSAITVSASGSLVSEGAPAPVSRMTLAGRTMADHKAIALVVLTDEILASATPAAVALVDHELRAGLAAAADGRFLAMLSAGAPSIASTAIDGDDALRELRALLALANTTGGGSLFWVLAPDVANRAAALGGIVGLMFPGMSPTGGEILNLPALVSDQLPAGQILLVDASGTAADVETITIHTANQASLQMADTPSDGAQPLVSLWQSNSVAFRAILHFSAERFRAGSVARLTGVNWGGAVPGPTS